MPKPEFTTASVRPVLEAACSRVGLSPDGAELIRLGENAIWRLRDAPVVVRIARSSDRLARVNKELCVARWLTSAGVPTVQAMDIDGQPLVVDDYPVTFWRAVDGIGPKPDASHLAVLLRAFHDAGSCPCDLPAFDPLDVVGPRIAGAADVKKADRSFLASLREDLSRQLAEMKFALPLGPIHGDAHTANLLPDRGQVVLLDFESSAYGPREWDLLPTAIAVDRYGLDEDVYRTFADSYGFDVREWDGYVTLRRVRELTMTTWLMQNVSESPAVEAEFNLRVSSLREGEFDRDWNFF